MTRLLLRLVIAISLVGCTTGSELLTPVYPAIEDHTAVTILVWMPEGAEQIAVLKASLGWGSNHGQFPEHWFVGLKRRAAAEEDLQRRAAKLGANAVVLNTTIDPSGRDEAQWKEANLQGVGVLIRGGDFYTRPLAI
jgi:hypothetical protein